MLVSATALAMRQSYDLNDTLLQNAKAYAEMIKYWEKEKVEARGTRYTGARLRTLSNIKNLLEEGANAMALDESGKNTLDYLEVENEKELRAKLNEIPTDIGRTYVVKQFIKEMNAQP